MGIKILERADEDPQMQRVQRYCSEVRSEIHETDYIAGYAETPEEIEQMLQELEKIQNTLTVTKERIETRLQVINSLEK